MIRRRSWTSPPSSQPVPGLHATRRRGARLGLSERVRFALGEREIAGWALNQGAGGLRAVIEAPSSAASLPALLEPGAELDVVVGAAPSRRCRIVWVQDELDGSIVGVCFLDALGAEATGAKDASRMATDADEAANGG